MHAPSHSSYINENHQRNIKTQNSAQWLEAKIGQVIPYVMNIKENKHFEKPDLHP